MEGCGVWDWLYQGLPKIAESYIQLGQAQICPTLTLHHLLLISSSHLHQKIWQRVWRGTVYRTGYTKVCLNVWNLTFSLAKPRSVWPWHPTPCAWSLALTCIKKPGRGYGRGTVYRTGYTKVCLNLCNLTFSLAKPRSVWPWHSTTCTWSLALICIKKYGTPPWSLVLLCITNLAYKRGRV